MSCSLTGSSIPPPSSVISLSASVDSDAGSGMYTLPTESKEASLAHADAEGLSYRSTVHGSHTLRSKYTDAQLATCVA